MAGVVANFYKFAKLPEYADWRSPLLDRCQDLGLKGTILLASEGINGTLAGEPGAIAAILSHLRQDPRLADLESQVAPSQSAPFERMKVKLKREIVTLGLADIDPTERVGEYVPPQAWNQLIADPEVLLIDTRNEYEVGIGSFQGAVNPHTASFREFPAYVQNHLNPAQTPKVAMFCTGGIRCEKATALLIQQGFEQVYHLQGGILKYLEEVPPEESRWRGECFVFDERVAVGHGLAPGSYDLCRACGYPINQADQDSEAYVEGVSCPHCRGRYPLASDDVGEPPETGTAAVGQGHCPDS